MKLPTPHNFSRSPVEEVFCSCTPDSESPPISLTIPAPYPGWEQIRRDLERLITINPEPTRFTGCILRYSDRFQFPVLEGTEALNPCFDPDHHLQDRIIGRVGDETIISSAISRATSSITYSSGKNHHEGVMLIFTVQTDAILLSRDEVIRWFDAAHAEIHILFDLCVPDQFRETLR